MSMFTEFDGLTTVPGYKAILKMVVKSQMQLLVEQLARYTGEESIVLTASTTDGTLSHMGSQSGTIFIQSHADFKSQFLGFCLQNETMETRPRDDIGESLGAATLFKNGNTPVQRRRKTKRPAQAYTFPAQPAKVQRESTEFTTDETSLNSLDLSRYGQSNTETFESQENNFYTSDSGMNDPELLSPNNNQSAMDMNLFTDEDQSGNKSQLDTQQLEISALDTSGIKVEETTDVSDTGYQQQGILDTSQSTERGDEEMMNDVDNKDAEFLSPERKSGVYPGSIKTEQGEEGACMYLTIRPGDGPSSKNGHTSTLDQTADNKDVSDCDYLKYGSGGFANKRNLSNPAPPKRSDPLSMMSNITVTCATPSPRGFLPSPRLVVNRSNPELYTLVHDQTSPQKNGYKCTFCDKEFRERQNLRVHIRVHTGEKPYSCGLCSKAFAHSSNLRQHERGVHKIFHPIPPWSYTQQPAHSKGQQPQIPDVI